ncbi:hypothetical protein MPNT_100053 [Candidatus Methylacidithermus pantelleriae]|uniref:Uncharacterized protein n=1 Tax=Candidatus Methylacidithermus pantelleriae TaxID=2744239 RepID=A0A8J2FRJ0_9BACT|nr:hypothetical protein MPNT_100053 [Candidatus Methylacidithermus pantelleriae]
MCFAYGQKAILQALSARRIVIGVMKSAQVVRKRAGCVVKLPFVLDGKGSRVFAKCRGADPFPG